MESISVALVSGLVPKDFSNPDYSFVFDEAYRLARRGTCIHAIRSFAEEESASYGILFHGLNGSFEIKYIPFILRHRDVLFRRSHLLPPWTLFYLSKYARTVADIIYKQNLDLIHAHFAYPEGFVGLLAKKETGKPLVVTVHGTDVLVEPSIGYGIRLSKRYDALVRRVIEEADAVIAASKVTYDEVCSIVKNIEKVHLIANGVDITRFNPGLDSSYLRRKHGLEGKFIVFSLRAHEPKYGLEYLIRSVPAVVEQMDNVVFIVGGNGSLLQYHEKLAAELGVSQKIIFTGKISSDDVPYYNALSNVVVVPSLQEAFGLVVSEAMACGKPIIGSNVGGIRDQIIDGSTGFLIEPREPLKIAEKILWLMTNPEEAKRMGINGRKRVEQKYNIENRAKSIINLYVKLLRDKN
jgi:glycosyltransferase involved in cell wall biosynthesis